MRSFDTRILENALHPLREATLINRLAAGVHEDELTHRLRCRQRLSLRLSVDTAKKS